MSQPRAAQCVDVGGGVTICLPPRGIVRRRVRRCPVCQRRTRHVQRFAGAYYDDELACVACGDSWSGGELMERPFQRGWRTRAIERARRMWADAMTPTQWREAVHEALEASLGPRIETVDAPLLAAVPDGA